MLTCKADSSGNRCSLPVKKPWQNEVLPRCSVRFFLGAQVWCFQKEGGYFSPPCSCAWCPRYWITLARDWPLYRSCNVILSLKNHSQNNLLPTQQKAKLCEAHAEFQDSVISLWMGLEWYLGVSFDARGIKIAVCFLPCACHLFPWKEEALVAYNGHESSCILLRHTGANNPLF